MNTSRLSWMDWLRGTSIILVIIYHIQVDAARFYDTPVWIQSVNDAVAPLRMPAMMFLSGLLVERSLKKGTRLYLGGKFRHIAWPYLIWSVIMIWALRLAGDEKDYRILFDIWREPISYLWFLHHLLAFYILAWFFRNCSVWVPACLVLLGSVVSDVLGNESRLLYLSLFFFGGLIASHYAVVFCPQRWRRAFKILFFFSLLSVLFIGAIFDGVRYQLILAPLVLLGIGGGVLVASLVRSGFIARFVRHIGANSLIFYLVHVPLSVALMPSLGEWIESAGLAIFVTAFSSVIISLILVWATSCWGWLNILFAWPRISKIRRTSARIVNLSSTSVKSD